MRIRYHWLVHGMVHPLVPWPQHGALTRSWQTSSRTRPNCCGRSRRASPHSSALRRRSSSSASSDANRSEQRYPSSRNEHHTHPPSPLNEISLTHPPSSRNEHLTHLPSPRNEHLTHPPSTGFTHGHSRARPHRHWLLACNNARTVWREHSSALHVGSRPRRARPDASKRRWSSCDEIA